jgi:hypothetical protein
MAAIDNLPSPIALAPPQQSAKQYRARNNQLGSDMAPHKPNGHKHPNRDEDAKIGSS